MSEGQTICVPCLFYNSITLFLSRQVNYFLNCSTSTCQSSCCRFPVAITGTSWGWPITFKKLWHTFRYEVELMYSYRPLRVCIDVSSKRFSPRRNCSVYTECYEFQAPLYKMFRSVFYLQMTAKSRFLEKGAKDWSALYWTDKFTTVLAVIHRGFSS
jgi:hypothetical protein